LRTMMYVMRSTLGFAVVVVTLLRRCHVKWLHSCLCSWLMWWYPHFCTRTHVLSDLLDLTELESTQKQPRRSRKNPSVCRPYLKFHRMPPTTNPPPFYWHFLLLLLKIRATTVLQQNCHPSWLPIGRRHHTLW
jgi:hypothetical protein